MVGDVSHVLKCPASLKNPHERDHRYRAIGEFSGGMHAEDAYAFQTNCQPFQIDIEKG
jgi:hypothetical protein